MSARPPLTGETSLETCEEPPRQIECKPVQKKAAATIRDVQFATEWDFWEFFRESELRGGVMDH
jgi:hypothetical protein